MPKRITEKPPGVGQKRFIVRKYVMAASVDEALRKESSVKPDDVWIDDDWKKDQKFAGQQRPIGFET